MPFEAAHKVANKPNDSFPVLLEAAISFIVVSTSSNAFAGITWLK
jgi:hypothetical protein